MKRESNFDRMNRQYGTPAKRGMGVEYDGERARITSCTGSHLRLRFPPGSKYAKYRGCTFHPLYKIDYLDGVDYRGRHDARVKAFVAALNQPTRAERASKEGAPRD